MSDIMPDVDNWEAYGFPDDLTFRTPYIPWVGLIKALNERIEARNGTPMDIPEYFTEYGGMYWESSYWEAWNQVYWVSYVNPDKISSAEKYSDCFWTPEELGQAALDGEDEVNVTSFMRPRYSVKWAIWQYNQINLLRYVPTSDPDDWPDEFTYQDINDTFNFKAP